MDRATLDEEVEIAAVEADAMVNPKLQVILDSGAFSAWTRDLNIDLNQYIEFIEKNRKFIWYPVNLDKIPGLRGIDPSAAAVEEAAKISWENALTMRRRGIECIPVYHQGEPLYWLDKMVGEGFKYVGISPSNSCVPKEREVWLDEVFDHLCGGKHPPVMTHAFGLTAANLLCKYPWFSADSMRWMVEAGWGASLVPRSVNGRYDFSKVPYSIHFSSGSLKEKPKWLVRMTKQEGLLVSPGTGGRHYDHLNKDSSSKAYIDEYLRTIGMTADQLRDDFNERARANVRFFRQLEAQHSSKTFSMKRAGLFRSSGTRHIGADSLPFEKFRLVYTVNGTKRAGDMLTDEGVDLTLVSYFYFLESRMFDLEKYQKTGYIESIPKERKARQPKEGRRPVKIGFDPEEIW